jgi:hypothetical protein
VPGVDFNETSAPTPRLASVRLLLAIITDLDLDARHIDVKGAYLQATLKEEVYMKQPPLFTDKKFSKKVCRLIKSIYGLRQAGREWWKFLGEWLKGQGFERVLGGEGTMYKKIIDGKAVVVLWYVDDGLLATTKGWMDTVIRILTNAGLEVTDLGEPTSLLNCKIERNREQGWMKLSQPGYIDALINRLNLTDAHPAKAPTAGVLLLPRSEDETDPAM